MIKASKNKRKLSTEHEKIEVCDINDIGLAVTYLISILNTLVKLNLSYNSCLDFYGKKELCIFKNYLAYSLTMYYI